MSFEFISLKSGKRGRKRKQKQKYGDLNSQSKKKQPRSTSTSHNSADAVTSVDNHVHPALLKNSCLAVHQLNGSNCIGESNGGISNDSTFHRAGDHAALTGLKESYREKQENKYDPKLIELRETTSSNKLSNSIQEGNSLEGGDLPNGTLKESCLGPAQNNHCRGAKKRKSGSVKRFKQDSTSCSAVLCPSLMPDFALDSSFGTISRLGTEVPGATENSSSQKQKTEELNIMKILRPMSFSASLPDDEVLVTFLALRSDGKEVMVDNRFLKAQNPLLLIDFYEQHLKYNTTS